MTKLNTDYEALIELGLPRLPEGYSYKFSIKDVTTSSRLRHRRTLYVQLRKHILGVPFAIQGNYWAREHAWDRWHHDTEKFLEDKMITFDQFNQMIWFPAHLAFLGAEAYDCWQRDRLKKEKQKNLRFEGTENIAHLLNKKMP